MRGTGQVEITERDQRVLQFAFEQRAISFDQIYQRYFTATKRRTVQYRLRRLVRDSYLVSSGIFRGSRMVTVFGLSQRGFDLIRRNYKAEITGAYFRSDSPLHDVAITDIRIRLEKAKMLVEYISENMLQACDALSNSVKFQPFAQNHSDAVLVLKGQSNTVRVALEFEASEKNRARYVKKITDYYFSPDIVAVFYICRGPRIERLIRKVDCDFDQKFKSKIYTCTEETIHSSVSTLPFTNRNNATFLLS